MPEKHIQPLLLSKKLYLPNWEVDNTKSFLHHYDSKMAIFINDLKALPHNAFGGIKKSFFLDRINLITQKLRLSLKSYLDGYPAIAYSIFKEMIIEADLSIELVDARTVTLKNNYPLYRIKKEYSPATFSGFKNGYTGVIKNIDLFHVPFQNRKNIGTTRFSIPGFPCLYLSDSLHTSWSECIDDEDTPFHSTCFQNHRPLYIVDLAPLNFIIEKNGGKLPNPLYNKTDSKKIIIDYTYLYPLIFACHSKIKYAPKYPGEIQFKSEYIIPQLLMQWYREQKLMVDGIRYLSCTSEKKFPRGKFGKFNYVIPVTECNETGFCDKLIMNFSSTSVYSYLNKEIGQSLTKRLASISTSLSKQPFIPLS